MLVIPAIHTTGSTSIGENINSQINITFPIGILAQNLNIHQRTLRIYDQIGILCPKRSAKNRRYYSFEDYKKAKFILFLTKNLALNLTGVKIIIKILEESNISLDKYIRYVDNIAQKVNID